MMGPNVSSHGWDGDKKISETFLYKNYHGIFWAERNTYSQKDFFYGLQTPFMSVYMQQFVILENPKIGEEGNENIEREKPNMYYL